MAQSEISDLDETDSSNTTLSDYSLDGAVANMSTMDNVIQATLGLLARWYASVSGGQLPSQGRLTLTSGVPVTTTDVTGAGMLYFTPYKGNQIGLYVDGKWRVRTFAETSLALTLTSGKPYDIFAYDNSETLALEVLVWTNDTTRATALTLQDGVYVKSGDATRRYLGTLYASGTNTTEDSFAKRFLWNYYNRVPRPMQVTEATSTWNYSIEAWRQANANAANQLQFVIGLVEDEVSASVTTTANNSAVAYDAFVGIGLDSTTALAVGTLSSGTMAPAAGYRHDKGASWRGFTGVGKHALVWLEYGPATGSVTWYSAQTTYQSGIDGSILG